MKLKFWNLCLILLFDCFLSTLSWVEWDYSTYWSDATSPVNNVTEESAWESIWHDKNNAPRPRKGHSLVIVELMNSSYLVLFGGRDNDRSVEHIPRTFNVKKVWFWTLMQCFN